jgi:hypothetical protein
MLIHHMKLFLWKPILHAIVIAIYILESPAVFIETFSRPSFSTLNLLDTASILNVIAWAISDFQLSQT